MKKLMLFSVFLATTAALPAHAGKNADLNGDGAVTREELMQRNNDALDVDEKMAKLDTNHDGIISSDEFNGRKNARQAFRNAKNATR